MNIVIVNMFSEDGLRATVMAEHVQVSRKFTEDWELALKAAKKNFPREWQVNDVERVMGDMGWRFKKVQTVEVRY